MPRKQNGFGSFKSSAFKKIEGSEKAKKIGSFGTYPSNRRFGALVVRTVIEKFNIDATWSKWRKGYEYFAKQKFVIFDIPNLQAEIFPSFKERIVANFSAIRFPTSGSDDATYYVTQRKLEQHPTLLTVTKMISPGDSDFKTIEQNYNEKWFTVSFNDAFPVALKLVKESITSKPQNPGEVGYQETYNSAIIKNMLTIDNTINSGFKKDLFIPAVYTSNSLPLDTEITIRVKDLSKFDGDAIESDEIPEEELQNFVGKQISIFDADSYYDKSLIKFEYSEIDSKVFKSKLELRGGYENSCKVFIYDAKPLADDAGVIFERDFLAASTTANFGFSGNFLFEKAAYQRWFNTEFNSSLMEQLVEFIAPLIPTSMTIQSIEKIDSSNPDYLPDENIIIKCQPFNSQVLYCKKPFLISSQPTYVMSCSKQSFTKEINTLDIDRNLIETKLNINVNPYEDETFVEGDQLWLQNRFACDCASYSKAKVTAPEARDGEGRKANRQRRYPLPTAGATRASDIIDNKNSLAGIFDIWRTEQDELKFQSCKHTMSAHFTEGLKVIEPNEAPILQDRAIIEERIVTEIDDNISVESVRRSELSSTGFVWSIVQLLVQTTAAIIASSGSDGRYFLKPIEFLYGFRKVRKLSSPVETDNASNLFNPKPGNTLNI